MEYTGIWRRATEEERRAIEQYSKECYLGKVFSHVTKALIWGLIGLLLAVFVSSTKVAGEPQTVEGLVVGLVLLAIIGGILLYQILRLRKVMNKITNGEYSVTEAQILDKNSVEGKSMFRGKYVSFKLADDRTYEMMTQEDNYEKLTLNSHAIAFTLDNDEGNCFYDVYEIIHLR